MGIRDIRDSSVSINSQKLYTDIPGVCSEAVRLPLEVYRHCQKPLGWSLEKVTDMKFVCGYTQIFPEVYKDDRDGFTDDKDTSRTIRRGFTDTFSVSHNTWEHTE